MATKEIDLSTLDLDWRLAARRLAKDQRDDFWPDPIGFDDILSVATAGAADHKILRTPYRPRRAVSFEIPKSNLTIRDSICLAPFDRLLYQALVDRISAPIDARLSDNVFSYRLRPRGQRWMFRPNVLAWRAFVAHVSDQFSLAEGSWLLVADLASYFETVRFRFLSHHLEQLLDDQLTPELRRLLAALMTCLTAWSPYDGFGLPQNLNASSFLGNAMLAYVDRRMEREGYQSYRYMDDFRIIVSNEAEGRRALMHLASYLREIGLWLNSGKTFLLNPRSTKLADYLPVDDPEIGAIEAAVARRQRHAVQAIVDPLLAKTRTLIFESVSHL